MNKNYNKTCKYIEVIKNLPDFWETCISLKTDYSKIYNYE